MAPVAALGTWAGCLLDLSLGRYAAALRRLGRRTARKDAAVEGIAEECSAGGKALAGAPAVVVEAVGENLQSIAPDEAQTDRADSRTSAFGVSLAREPTSVLGLNVPRTVVDQGQVRRSRANARGNEIEPRAFALDRRGLARRGAARGVSGSAKTEPKGCLVRPSSSTGTPRRRERRRSQSLRWPNGHRERGREGASVSSSARSRRFSSRRAGQRGLPGSRSIRSGSTVASRSSSSAASA
jgi:hypothetical protein